MGRCLQFMQSLFVEVEAPGQEEAGGEGPQGESAQATGAVVEQVFLFSRCWKALACCMNDEPQ